MQKEALDINNEDNLISSYLNTKFTKPLFNIVSALIQ
jgi:hypothetical protein